MNTFYKIIDTSLKNRIGKIHNPFDVNRDFFDIKSENVYLKRDNETYEGFRERVEGYQEIEIGIVYFDIERYDNYTDMIYLDFSIYQNFKFSIPRIALVYIDKNNIEGKLQNGKYPLVARLKVFDGKIYGDINNIYIKEEKGLVKVNTLVLMKAEYETFEEFEKRVNYTPYINIGAVKLREDKYIEDVEILPIKIGFYKWFKIKSDIVKSFIRLRKEDIKKLSIEQSTIPLYGKVALFEGQVQIADTFIYIESIDRVEAINIEGITFSLEDFARARDGVEEAILNLANLYDMQEKYQLALKWYNKAVSLGNLDALTMIQNYYNRGMYRDKNLSPYFDNYKNLISNGQDIPVVLLGNMFRLGIGVKSDYKKAIKLYSSVVEEDKAATRYLASMYKNGLGVEKDIKKAIELYEKAAKLSDVESQLSLGMIYEIGIGCEKNFEKALKWYKLAEAAGSEDAKKYIEDIDFALKSKNVEEDNYEIKSILESLNIENIDESLF
ncbi:tetratricopeptide repeat protein [Clostridium cylindrosporum]|uniref:Uncharacterized protein n=1 Tax=Clostridium cylindrosporum DSM 605 TaxID=1121307 RepID=A0A0J8DG03_CLOCY|nr:tetratricopeptide repeat protein [Clostridium cylindrosporum]KMT23164.1 hypothetical protein CLCY_6c00450 [Clostridium cylindrosporum DSM 605]